MYATKWKFDIQGNTPPTIEAKSKTGLYAHAGFEATTS